jgi:hypothetical protein
MARRANASAIVLNGVFMTTICGMPGQMRNVRVVKGTGQHDSSRTSQCREIASEE